MVQVVSICLDNCDRLNIWNIEPDVSLQEQDFWHGAATWIELGRRSIWALSMSVSDNMKELSYPYTPHEPELTAEELQRLDSIADRVEGLVERLSGLNVLLEDNLPSDAKCLSTRFVRTWREKKDQDGNAIWLRRSRLVAREYTWLQPDREALFSPASSNIATRILPICFLALREHQETLMLAIDVKDAFLTVEQEQPTQVKCTAADGTSISYSLGQGFARTARWQFTLAQGFGEISWEFQFEDGWKWSLPIDAALKQGVIVWCWCT